MNTYSIKDRKKEIKTQIDRTFLIYCAALTFLATVTGVFDFIKSHEVTLTLSPFILFGFAFFLTPKQFNLFRKNFKIFVGKRLYINEKHKKLKSNIGFFVAMIFFGFFVALSTFVWIQSYVTPVESWLLITKISVFLICGAYMAYFVNYIFSLEIDFDPRVLKVLGRKP